MEQLVTKKQPQGLMYKCTKATFNFKRDEAYIES
jgi:hypothetical protein